MTVKRRHSVNQKAAGHLGGGGSAPPCTLPLDPPLLSDEKLSFVSAHSGRLYLKQKYRTQLIQNIIFSFIFNFHSLSFSSP